MPLSSSAGSETGSLPTLFPGDRCSGSMEECPDYWGVTCPDHSGRKLTPAEYFKKHNIVSPANER